MQNIESFIWNIADLLRGAYRPPQYRRVMLPLTVLRRIDCVLEGQQEQVLDSCKQLKEKYNALSAQEKQHKTEEAYISQFLDIQFENLYNISEFNFQRILDDSEHIKQNLIRYIDSFSPKIREIFSRFNFEQEIDKLDENNLLYQIIQHFNNINLHPDVISNHDMGNIFENLIRRFNEQANEEAGDHFTPREVIKLMANILYTDVQPAVFDVGIIRNIYDPTCGTGGMLSVSKDTIAAQNNRANIKLYGQEYNAEAWAICASDMLMKGDEPDDIFFGDTLINDHYPHKKFHYILANPPFGVDWKKQQNFVTDEHNNKGFDGRFGAGLPRVGDGAMLFLQHMLSKMEPDGAYIAIVLNGSPLFTGDAGSGESNIRRYIIENDWLDAIIALPNDMFYNTGIATYIWIITNNKSTERQGKIQLIDGTRFYKKMRKSLGNKRNELSDEHIAQLTRIYGEYKNNHYADIDCNGEILTKQNVSKIFNNQDFGFVKLTIERPLQLNFMASEERIKNLWQENAFVNLSKSKKRKNEEDIKKEEAAGKQQQQQIIDILSSLDSTKLYKNRDAFAKDLTKAFKAYDVKLEAAIKKAILSALSEHDETADYCYKSKGVLEADTTLRDTENMPLPADIPLPLPMGYNAKDDNRRLVELIKDHAEAYLQAEVLPHVKDAWIDYSKTKLGYEIPFNKQFYVYTPPRPLEEIAGDIEKLEQEIISLLGKVV